MKFTNTSLAGSYIIEPAPFTDERGWFARYYCENEFREIGHTAHWVQINHSVSNTKGTIRGMHYQLPPHAEIKLVRCIAGEVFDVIVDLRKDSPTFLQWFGASLSATNKKMMYIPAGFAHGFQCLADNCELLYHHSDFYTPAAESGVKYNDPGIGIEWPLPVTLISERDNGHELLDANFKGV